MQNSIDHRLRTLLGEPPKNFWEEKITARFGYWGDRIAAELFFANEMSKVHSGKYQNLIHQALTIVENDLAQEGVIHKQTVEQAENLLSDLVEESKSYEILCVSHAHIDMNWMWAWDETVAITLDTFRTMLTLMDEYPEFTFSQSQAAVYRIVEQYAPTMLDEIRKRVQEGRWEVTASHWVEADKNLPNGESLTRQMLYTRRYLSDLFDLDPDGLNLDFEPDTFGHSIHVPEILNNAGVKYYYHCRGNDAPPLYVWEAPSGKSIIVYREPTWYNDNIQYSLGSYVPSICQQTGLKTYLNVYGVGDHGGGPTRRDLERILDLNRWPIYPKLRFGTYREFFALAEHVRHHLPVIKGEQNFIFTGCYTSQSRIKTANRISEVTLHDAELFQAIASVSTGDRYPGPEFEKAWRNVLFNQFHDILPGSCVEETREYARGLFQETMAVVNTHRKLALENLAAKIDTSVYQQAEVTGTMSEGAGVGFGSDAFKITQVERGRGNTRIFHVFNPLLDNREEVVEFILWDWKIPVQAIKVLDCRNNPVSHQVMDAGFHTYWNHEYMRLLVDVKVPAGGYATYVVTPGEEVLKPYMASQLRKADVESYVLENESIKATFHPQNASIQSLIDKSTGEELVDTSREVGIFRLILEDPNRRMSAWRVGRYMQTTNLHQWVKIRKGSTGEVRQSLNYEMAFGHSSLLKVTVSLDRHFTGLMYEVECDWRETGSQESGIPQLNFYCPFPYACESFKYDVPFGVIERGALDMDVPANSFVLGVPERAGQCAMMLMTRDKHGFRGTNEAMSVSLIRSSFQPDPYPEVGKHHFTFALCVVEHTDNHHLMQISNRFNHSISVLSGTAHSGAWPLENSFINVLEGTVTVSAIKMPEENDGTQWIVRMYETEGRSTKVRMKVCKQLARACFVDVHEQKLPDAGQVHMNGDEVSFDVAAHASATICVTFES